VGPQGKTYIAKNGGMGTRYRLRSIDDIFPGYYFPGYPPDYPG
jgi:hypothetical protein